MKLIYNVGGKHTIGEYETMQEVWDAFVQEMTKRFVYLKGPINLPFMEAKGFTIEQSRPKKQEEEAPGPKQEFILEKPPRKTERRRNSSK